MPIDFLHMTKQGKAYMEQVREMESMEVRIGFQAGFDPYEDGTELPDVAAYNEFGGSDRPARPFMRQSFENHEDKLRAICNRANETLAQGGTAQVALKKVGAECVGLIQEEIRKGGFAPNAPSTIKRKGSDVPLIDTGHMRQSVRFVIEKAK